MKLKAVTRTGHRKCESKQMRRQGMIPAILYRKGNKGEKLAIIAQEFNAHLRHVPTGHLPTTRFTLVDESGKEREVIVKEIQYNVTTYDVTHLDFEELVDNEKINVKVPIECVGQAECNGIKLGGVLRQVIRHVRVRCLPSHLPTNFQLNIRELGLRQSKRLQDLQIPEQVRPLVNLNEVVAVIVKR